MHFNALPSLYDYDVKVPYLTFLGGCEQKIFSYFFPELPIQSFRIQLQEKVANIWRIERDGISGIKFEAARVHLLSDVFEKRRLFQSLTLIFGPTCQCFFVIISIQLLLTFEFVRCPCYRKRPFLDLPLNSAKQERDSIVPLIIRSTDKNIFNYTRFNRKPSERLAFKQLSPDQVLSFVRSQNNCNNYNNKE